MFVCAGSGATRWHQVLPAAVFIWTNACSRADAGQPECGSCDHVRLLLPQLYEVEDMVVIAVDVLNQLADYNSALLRDHILKHQSDSVDEVCLFVHLSVRPSVCLSIRPSVRLSVCPSVRLSVCITHLLLQDSQFLNIIIGLLVDAEITSKPLPQTSPH